MLLSLKCQAARRASTDAQPQGGAVGWTTPRIEIDPGLFTVRAAAHAAGAAHAWRLSGVRASPVQAWLGVGVGPSIVNAICIARRASAHHAPPRGFQVRG